jgi:hypothetical protein
MDSMEKALGDQIILNPALIQVNQMYEIAVERINLPVNDARVRRNNQLKWSTAVKNLRIALRQNRIRTLEQAEE